MKNQLERSVEFSVIIIIAIAFAVIHYRSKQNYYNELKSSFKGVITKKYWPDPDNPKECRIKINDSMVYSLDFNLIEYVDQGDTIVKPQGRDYYLYYKKGFIIKNVIPKRSFIWTMNRADQGRIDTIWR
ncbi:hypothetical protein [Ferruginibacter albus]|uniref:hypothetical protein n=1 Tax=Ferruginibacter albus TaxID=2875540 RepID=UPI001CC6A888|nr:hypothetical protein [Ferruginibacter albus]UAY51477.1 hypothetical protein K9M53_12875 [Ferruginibacter albus]